MNETSKCHAMRLANGHFDKYLRGHGIDIGCGPDPLRPPNGTVYRWDIGDGDAQYLAAIGDESFDFVYSSHCLEHLRDIPIALANWQRVLKPGGFLYVVVPDYLLYEKLCFPSRHNGDHKHTFSFDIPRYKVGRENHWTLRELTPLLGNIRHMALDDLGFDYNRGCDEQTMGTAMSQLCIITRK